MLLIKMVPSAGGYQINDRKCDRIKLDLAYLQRRPTHVLQVARLVIARMQSFGYTKQVKSQKIALLSTVVALAFSYCDSLPVLALPPTTAPAKSDMNSVGYDMIQKAGHEAFENNEFGKAERLLKDAVNRATVFGPEDMRLAKSAGELGSLLTVRGRFSEAQPYLEEELYVKRRAQGNADGKLIPSMASLVKFYLLYGTTSKADPLANEILEFITGKLRDAGSQAQSSMKYQKGQVLQAWAGQAAPVAITPLLEWAVACDELANIYTTRGGYEMAERMFKAALDVKTTILGKHHLSLANSYDSLGSICALKDEYVDAESYFRDSLEITEKIQPSTSQVYNRLDKLAKCLIKEGKLDEAEALYVRAQSFWATDNSNNGGAARAAYALGNLYLDEKKYAEAAPILEKALQIARTSFGVDSVVLVPYLERLAYDYYYINRRDESDELKARAKVIQPPQLVAKELTPDAKMELGTWPSAAADPQNTAPKATASTSRVEQQ
ncbi:MAG TPA: tetratricopeptide repeat protein [Oculatellaceae cyanobacterium]